MDTLEGPSIPEAVTMESYKRKHFYKSSKQQHPSKHSKEESKIVLRVIKNDLPDTGDLIKGKTTASKRSTKVKNPKREQLAKDNKLVSVSMPVPDIPIKEELPSIVLYSSNSSLNDSVLEQHLDISPHSVVKKIKIIPTCELVLPGTKLKQKPYRERKTGKGKIHFPREWDTLNLNQIPLPPSSFATNDKESSVSLPTSGKYHCGKSVHGSKGGQRKERTSHNEVEEKLIAEKVRIEEARLRAENERLSRLLTDVKDKVQKVNEIQSYRRERLTLAKLKQNHEMLYYYVGFKDLDSMVQKLTDYFSLREKVNNDLLIEDQLVMTLMKLRRNYSMHDLAFRFRVTPTEADCIVFNIILALHDIYFEKDLKQRRFPPTDEMISYLPEQFHAFPNCRVVLECVRIACEDPDLEFGSDIFTSTKFDPKVYVKGLLGISPLKHVLFASGIHEDGASNADVFMESGIFDKLVPGDLIMADVSFSIGEFLPQGIELNVSGSTKGTLTDKQIKNLNSKARAFIGRTTMQHIRRFSILNYVPLFLSSIVVQIFQLCSALVNLQPTITQTTQLWE